MDERSYIDLGHKKTCCSATTLVLFLVYVCEDVDAFVGELRFPVFISSHTKTPRTFCPWCFD